MNPPLHAIKAPVFAALAALMITFGGEGFGAPPDLATIDARLLGMVQNNVDNPWPDPLVAGTRAWGLPCYALSCLYLNTDTVTANAYLNAFHDEFPIPDSDTFDFESYFMLHLV